MRPTTRGRATKRKILKTRMLASVTVLVLLVGGLAWGVPAAMANGATIEAGGPYLGAVGTEVVFDGTGPYGDAPPSRYELMDTPMFWEDARDAAAGMTYPGSSGSAHLVTITSADEASTLWSTFDVSMMGRHLGGYQDAAETDPAAGWHWVTGEPWVYTHWAPSEPNDSGTPGAEQFLHTTGWYDAEWNDRWNQYIGSIVEYEDCGGVFDWDFGDGSQALDAGSAPAHSYEAAGVYEVTLTVRDYLSRTNYVTYTASTYVVVYDPSAGFVTGGGWIDSPAEAYYPADLPFFDGSYYQLVNAAGIAWDSASAQADAMTLPGCGDAHLVTITSQEEQDALYGMFGSALQGRWYGGYQNEGETDPAAGWNWVTGEPWDYTNWAPGEPNDVSGIPERYLEGWASGWAWNDEHNLNYIAGYVVEYDDCLAALTGKANFGFVSKYQKGATVPTGNTEFQFKAGNLNLHSDSYEWLVVTGSDYAKFKGVGSINGEGAYKFMVWAGDETGADGVDTFRIKIWQEADGTEVVVYDNGMDQAIGGGSVVVHAK